MIEPTTRRWESARRRRSDVPRPRRLSIEPLESRTLLDATASIGGLVFDDTNRDGTHDGSETGLADWTVQLQPVGATDQPVQTLANPTPDEWSQFGRFVEAVGDDVLVGSHYDDVSGFPDAGAAYLFDGQTGQLRRTLLSPDPRDGDKFGRALAATDRWIAVGAPLDDSVALDAGAVYVFDAETGDLSASYPSPTAEPNGQFGRAVALVGDKLLVGSRFGDPAGEDAGAAYLFDLQTGVLEQTFVSPHAAPGAQFGYAVAAMGENALIAARYDETGAAGLGAVYLFDGATGNLLQTFVNPSQRANGEATGFAHDIAVAGDNVLVGARWDDAGVDGAGAAYLFDGASGELLHTFVSPTPFEGEEFGFSVAGLGEDVIVGARWDNRWDGLADDSGGAAYVFDGNTGQLLQTLANPAPGAWDAFGISVGAVGQRVIVGSRDGNAVYVFDAFAEAQSVATNTDGTYQFAGLGEGTYRVQAASPSGHAQTGPDAPGTYTVILSDAQSVGQRDFGFVENQPPETINDTYVVVEDQSLVVPAETGVLANDDDSDGDTLTAVLVNRPQHGQLTWAADGSFSYEPDADFFGSESFTYRAFDGLSHSDLATVRMTITPVNDAPTAGDDAVWALLNTPRQVAAPGVLADDVDADGDELTANLVDPPLHGVVAMQADGGYVYTPDPDYAGPDQFTYRAGDGQIESNLATVYVTVTLNTPDALKDHLRVSEVNYHPYLPTVGERALGLDDRESFEFVELTNTASFALDLNGLRLRGDASTELLSQQVILGPGQYALLVKDVEAFEARYGSGLPVLGQYTGELHDSGGRIELVDPFDRTILDFLYDDRDAWPYRADGFGASLEVLDVNGDYSSGENWRASSEYGGSPGELGAGPLETIAINEVLTHANLPQTDTVELLNRSSASIDVSGWYLSDTANNYKSFRIPDGTTLAPGEYVVFDEHDFNPGRWNPGAGGFAFDSALGDDLWLMAADPQGRLTHFVDYVDFRAALNSESFGRWPNGTGVLYPMTEQTFGAQNSGPRVGPIVISEVMYNAGELGTSVLDFIEIYNPTTSSLDLRNWRIRGDVDFDFPNSKYPEPVWFEPGEVILVVGFDPKSSPQLLDQFETIYGMDRPIQFFGPYRGGLASSGSVVRLLRADGPAWWEPDIIPHPLEDEIPYGPEDPWPASANGEGHSLHRRGVDRWGHDPQSWVANVPSPGIVDLQVGALAVAEINYHPHDPVAVELAVNPNFTADHFEFVELLNVSGQPISLAGTQLTDAVAFSFPDLTLAPGDRAVVVADMLGFTTRYGAVPNVVGQFSRNFDNNGERVTLLGDSGQTLLSFTYGDRGAWPERADGQGSTLELVDAIADYADGVSWRASYDYGGSPGVDGVVPITTVVVNEVLVNAGDPLADQIELYNTARGPIDISGWYLSNSGNNARKFRIPNGTVIDAFSYVVFSGPEFVTPPDGNGFTLDGFEGDQVYLVETDEQNDPKLFADFVEFGAIADGESWGRWPSGQGPLYPMTEPTFGEFGDNAGPRVGPMVITEVMYHPRDPGDVVVPSDLEYVELFNPLDETVDLNGWQVAGGIQFAFTEPTLLAPRESVIVLRFDPQDVQALTTFRQHYGIGDWVDVVGGFDGSLSNRGDTVTLLRPWEAPDGDPGVAAMLLEDQVIYSDQSPWPATADGFGFALHRKATNLWGNDVANWFAAQPSPGIIEPKPESLAIAELNYHPLDPTAAELAIDPGWTSDDFEFIELINLSGEPLELAGLRLTEGVSFDFPIATLQPAERALIVHNQQAFTARYGQPSAQLLGQYTDTLGDTGEWLTLQDADDDVLLRFAYGHDTHWPQRADGHGSSLEIVDLAGYYNDPDNWRPSTELGGSPGVLGRGPRSDVVINEVLARSATPYLDAIELYNITDQAIDVGGWLLTDDDVQLDKFRIPDATAIPAHGYLVFDERDFNPNGVWNPEAGTPGPREFALDGENGGGVWLVETLDDQPIEFADEFRFGAGGVNRSFGRWPNGVGDVYPLVSLTLDRSHPELGDNAVAMFPGSLVITELNYAPAPPSALEQSLGIGDADQFEFIELQNLSPYPYDLTGLEFVEGIEFDFEFSTFTELEPGAFVVVVRDVLAFQARYGAVDNVAGQYSRRLSDNGEDVRLLDGSGQALLDFEYEVDDPWPTLALGGGASLELSDPTSVPLVEPARQDYLEDPAHWRASREVHGSPGREAIDLQRSVIINEVTTSEAQDGRLTVELYNTTDAEVALENWYLAFPWYASAVGMPAVIPQGTTIGPHEHLTIEDLMLGEIPSWGWQWSLSLVAGSLDLAGGRFVDTVSVYPTMPGHALGRWPDAEGAMYPMRWPTPGWENAGPRFGTLVISELHYHSEEADGYDDLEFIEVFNPTLAPIPLADWAIEGGVSYAFNAGLQVDPLQTVAVLSFNPDNPTNVDRVEHFRNFYGLDESAVLVGGYDGKLSNGGESVRLVRVFTMLEDEAHYDDRSPWPLQADGRGASLQRTTIHSWGNDPESWVAQSPTPGTAGLLVNEPIIQSHLLYNQSAFDGYDPRITPADEFAVAPDKVPLLQNQRASFDNYTSFVGGINALRVGIFNAAAPEGITLDSFDFRVGNSDDVGQWAPAPAPQYVDVQPASGPAEATQVTIVWPTATIINQWLEVKVLADEHTGLLVDNVFYYGNAIGETGNADTNALVTAADLIAIRNHQRGPGNRASIVDPHDINRDRLVDALDRLMARNNVTDPFASLQLITPTPASPVPPPEAAEGEWSSPPTHSPRATATPKQTERCVDQQIRRWLVLDDVLADELAVGWR